MKVREYYKRHVFGIQVFCIFLFSFLLFGIFQWQNAFADIDSFYHAKMAVLMKDGTIIYGFPWMQFSVLKENFTDQYFLYHIALIPFVWFFDPLVGLKISTALFASCAIFSFFWVQRKLGYRTALFFTFLILLPNAFLFRLNLAKSQPLSFFFFYIFLYFLLQKKFFSVFILSFFFVWLHGSWPLSLVCAILYTCSDMCLYFLRTKKEFFDLKKKLMLHTKLLLSSGMGLLFGLCINPYFPKTFIFYWHQIFKIAVINYKNVIEVGSEWLSYPFLEFISHTNISLIFFMLSFFLFLYNRKKIDTDGLFFLCLSILFLAVSFKSRRYVEYFIPISFFFSSWCFSQLLSVRQGKNPISEIWIFLRKEKKFLPFLLFSIFFFPVIIFFGYKELYRALGSGFELSYLKKASSWMQKNTKKDEVIFVSNWDDFGALFYYNDHNFYLAGLDPTFMYNFNPVLYKKWDDIINGEFQERASEMIKKDFQSQFVLITSKRAEFSAKYGIEAHFRLLYSDTDADIYKVL